MTKIIGFFISSLASSSIWKEAVKSLFYFIISFLIITLPIYKILSFVSRFYQVDKFHVILNVSIMLSSVILGLTFAFIILIFLRDNYFYKIVTRELDTKNSSASNTMNQLKSIIRVIFLISISTIGLIISIFMPVVGFLLMSFCFGLEVFSYTFDVKKVGLRYSIGFIFGNFFTILLLGACFLTLSLIPGIGLISYPASIRAGALYYKSLEARSTHY